VAALVHSVADPLAPLDILDALRLEGNHYQEYLSEFESIIKTVLARY
jgi:hypothetical protein